MLRSGKTARSTRRAATFKDDDVNVVMTSSSDEEETPSRLLGLTPENEGRLQRITRSSTRIATGDTRIATGDTHIATGDTRIATGNTYIATGDSITTGDSLRPQHRATGEGKSGRTRAPVVMTTVMEVHRTQDGKVPEKRPKGRPKKRTLDEDSTTTKVPTARTIRTPKTVSKPQNRTLPGRRNTPKPQEKVFLEDANVDWADEDILFQGSIEPDYNYSGHLRTATPSQTTTASQTMEQILRELVKRKPAEQTRLDCVPEFDPLSATITLSTWLHKLEQLQAVYSWSENTLTYHMQAKLRGPARKWYDNLLYYNLTWDEWKQKLKKTFPDHKDDAEVMRKMMNYTRKSGEDYTDYYFTKLALLEPCKLNPQQAVSFIIDGLGDRLIQIGARSGGYQTPEDLYSNFVISLTNPCYTDCKPTTDLPQEGENQEFQSSVDCRTTENTCSNKRRTPNNSGPRNEQNRDTNGRSQENTQEQSTSSENRPTQNCYNCKSPTHRFYNCPEPKKECSRCKFLGHEEKDCKRKVPRVNRVKGASQNRDQSANANESGSDDN